MKAKTMSKTWEELKAEGIFDVRDAIERLEELEAARDDVQANQGASQFTFDDDDKAELATLASVLDELKGNGGDHDWRGDWYPVTIIPEAEFEDYARDMAEDICGEQMRAATWPLSCIDWEQAARELKIDYTSADLDGISYLFR